jgi:hypothetical protein
VFERRGEAIFLPPGQKPPQFVGKIGEMNHLHLSDLSGHVVLSLADAKEVVAKGWVFSSALFLSSDILTVIGRETPAVRRDTAAVLYFIVHPKDRGGG